MTKLAPESMTSYYDEAVKREGLSENHGYLLDHVAPGSTVLELGPASGYMTRILAAKGCVVDAIEINPADAEKAASFCRTMVIGSIEDVENFKRLAGPYDVILIADVLEHLRAPEKILPLLRERLAKGGEAIVSLPNIAFWKMRFELLRGRFEYTDMGLLDRTHLRFYTLKSARDLFFPRGVSHNQRRCPTARHDPALPPSQRVDHQYLADGIFSSFHLPPASE
jgi:2-polyprenyl-3-methyl-5-hydroxy-6-metoxy-1,4-benzoquinol methylase